MLVVWNPFQSEDGTLLATIPEPVYALAAMPNDTLIAGSSGGSLFVVQQQQPRRIEAHQKGVFAIHPVSDQAFISIGGDGQALMFGEQQALLFKQQLSHMSLRCCCRVGDDLLAFGSSDSHIYLTDKVLRVKQVLSGHEHSVFAAAWLSESNMLVSGGRDAVFRTYQAPGFASGAVIQSHLFHIHSIAANEALGIFASGSMDKSLKFWDSNSLELLKVIAPPRKYAHSSSVNCLLWLNENTLVSSSDDRSIRVWEVNAV